MAAVSVGTTSNSVGSAYVGQHKIVKTTVGKLFLVGQANNKIGYKVSTDNGVTWSVSWTDISTRNTTSSIVIDSSNNIHITYNTSTAIYYRLLTYSAGPQTWSIGSEVIVASSLSVVDGASICIDSSNNIWVVPGGSSVGVTTLNAYYSADGVSWTSKTITQPATYYARFTTLIAVGSDVWAFVVSITGTTYKLRQYIYTTSWDAGTVIDAAILNNSIGSLCISTSETYVTASTSSGIKIYLWNGATWDTGTLLSNNALDTGPFIMRGNSKPLVVWSDYDGANYDIAYRTWNGSTWDAQINLTTDATIDKYANGAMLAGTTFYVCWTSGAASPYTIYFDTIAVPPVTISSNFSLNATIKKVVEDSFSLAANVFLPSFDLQATIQSTINDDYSLLSVIKKTISNSFTLNSSIIFIERKVDEIDWEVEGALSTGTEVAGFRPASGIAEIIKVLVSIKDTGSAGNTIIDVNKNGTTIFTAPGDRPTVAYNNTERWIESKLSTPLLIREGENLSIDIDDVATDAEDLVVRVVVRRLVYVRPTVNKVEIMENGIRQLTAKILPSTKFSARIIFNVEMDTFILPTVTIRLVDGTEVDASSGTWTHTNLEYDTYVTDEVTLLVTQIGKGTIEVKGAKGKTTLDMYPEVMSEEFELVDEVRIAIEDDTEFTNQANINLILNYVQADQMQFSMNNSTWSTLEDYASTKILDMTSGTIGGSSAEGAKTIYVKFKVGDALTTAYSIVIGYYTTLPIVSFYTDLVKDNTNNSNQYTIIMNYPTTALVVPIKTVNIYVDDILIFSEGMLDTISGLAMKTIDTNTRVITFTAGTVLTRGGIVYTFAEDTAITIDDIPIAAGNTDRIDLLYIDDSGNLTTIKGKYGLIESTLPAGTSYRIDADGKLYPRAPRILDTYIPLFYIYLSYTGLAYEGGKLVQNRCLDLRKQDLKYTLPPLPDGERDIKVEVIDVAGRVGSTTETVTASAKPRFGRIRAYTSLGYTTEILSGQPTTTQVLYIKVT